MVVLRPVMRMGMGRCLVRRRGSFQVMGVPVGVPLTVGVPMLV